MKWLQVTGYPQYYVNELFEVKRVFDDGSVTTYTANIPHVVLRKKGRPPCTEEAKAVLLDNPRHRPIFGKAL